MFPDVFAKKTRSVLGRELHLGSLVKLGQEIGSRNVLARQLVVDERNNRGCCDFACQSVRTREKNTVDALSALGDWTTSDVVRTNRALWYGVEISSKVETCGGRELVVREGDSSVQIGLVVVVNSALETLNKTLRVRHIERQMDGPETEQRPV